MKKKKCSLHIFDGEKMLHGTVAITHHISNCGGWDKFNEDLINSITVKVIGRVTEELVPIIYKEIMDELSKPKLEIV